jgi:hypothetical protein
MMRAGMRRTVLAAILIIAASASRAEPIERFMEVLRDQLSREDCLWREMLRRHKQQSETLDQAKEAAGRIAFHCSQNIRAQILRRATPEHDMKELAGYDLIAATERARSIATEVREIMGEQR